MYRQQAKKINPSPFSPRRKIILGGLIETHCEMHPDSAVAREVPRLIERFVKGEKERALFGLDSLPVEKTSPTPESKE